MPTPATRVDEILRTRAPGALDELIPVVSDELKRMARHHRRANDPSATLSTTELVHEAFLKLAPPETATGVSRLIVELTELATQASPPAIGSTRFVQEARM